ncbi:bifunctional (p)ppGpp synthetase/guanosine-3',5'-bis(diphosphate) 3'-pyrophosphohydrolase, partial [Rhizobium leguminosarum]
IYPIQSPSLQRFDDQPDRLIDVRWDLDEANKSLFMARIMVNGLNEPGTLAKVAQTVPDLDLEHHFSEIGRHTHRVQQADIDVEACDR